MPTHPDAANGRRDPAGNALLPTTTQNLIPGFTEVVLARKETLR
jgi:hypothetical protein